MPVRSKKEEGAEGVVEMVAKPRAPRVMRAAPKAPLSSGEERAMAHAVTVSTSASSGASRGRRSSTPAFVGAVLVSLLIVVAVTVFIARMDDGEIDVTAAIEKSNQANLEAGNTAAIVQTVPEEFQNMPNGGLVPQENSGVPQEQVPTDMGTTTSTTTDSGADTPTSAESEKQNTSGEGDGAGETQQEPETTPVQ